jgi:hypothetical protein
VDGCKSSAGLETQVVEAKGARDGEFGLEAGSPDWDIDGPAFLQLDAAVWGIDIELATAAADRAVRARNEPVRVGFDQIL